jgi:ABC-type maltose transport system permease subunit
MNRIKAVFTNRKFSLNGLIEVICIIVQFIALIVTFVTLCWLFNTYPAETGGALGCIFGAALVCWILRGIFDTIFPKINEGRQVDRKGQEGTGKAGTNALDIENKS